MYTEQERSIYVTPAGSRLDPLALHRKLVTTTGGTVNDLLTHWQSTDPVASAVAEDKLVIVSRSIFQLKGIDQEDGVTDAVVLETLVHFLEYLEKKEVTENSNPTLLTATVSPVGLAQLMSKK